MSTTEGGGNIVTDGLVLLLDAANTKSYVSGSTTWNDISRGGNNGSLINGPTFNSLNGGSIVFDGVNDYVSGSVGTLNASFSIEYFGKFNNSLLSNYEYFGSVGNATPYGMVSVSRLGTLWPTISQQGLLYCYPGSDGIGPVIFNISLTGTSWQHIVLVLTTSLPYIKAYKNGVEGTILSSNLTQQINTNGIYRIATWANSTWWLNGNLAIHRIYNRALSATEIQQNFNATRSRFGI